MQGVNVSVDVREMEYRAGCQCECGRQGDVAQAGCQCECGCQGDVAQAGCQCECGCQGDGVQCRVSM